MSALRDILDGPVPKIAVAVVLLRAAWLLLLRKPPDPPALRSVAILVLGDIGRSPRMMYHAESLAKSQFTVYFIGYGGSTPTPSLLSLPLVCFLWLTEPPAWLRKLPFIVFAPLKIAHQVFSILRALLWRIPHPPEFILVQNPPSIPTLALVWLVGTLRGSKVIIDWHNLGYSILALNLGPNHIFVTLAKRFEAWFGRSAYAHLFVTHAMRDFLVKEWKLEGIKAVLHDRPPAHFHPANASEVHELFLRIAPLLPRAFLPAYDPPVSTPLTHVTTAALPSLRPDRPAVLVSSTSWTEDEDFSILLDALAEYERRARAARGTLPRILMLVTGKGPLREAYMRRVQALQSGAGGDDEAGWQWVRVVSMWLEAKDYPLLLGSADLGVSLHSSSSALDLPMKIVDMFGCGVPVCALEFACLAELVKDGLNGVVFQNAGGLAEQLQNLLEGFPKAPRLEALRASLRHVAEPRGAAGREEDREWEWNSWDDNWTRVVRPLVLPSMRAPE